MITLEALTLRQRELMDCLWSLESLQEVEEFFETLDWEDQCDARSLVWIVSEINLEQEGGLDAHKDAASALIARASMRG
jgi:hypothetical protein